MAEKVEFYKEMEFKDTEIGRIPKEWEVVKLGDGKVAEIRGNESIKGTKVIAFIPMELIPDSGIFARYELRALENVRSFTFCRSGDLLLAKITPSLENGKQGLVPEDVPGGFALATTEVYPISCRGIHSTFLFYVLKYPRFRNKIIASMIGTTGRQRASKESIKNLVIPFSSLPEQQQIASILSTIDDAIQKTDEVIAKTERLKKGMMKELLTKGIGHKEFKDTEIGRIPKEWKVGRVTDFCDVRTGGTPSMSHPEYFGGGIKWIRSGDIHKKHIYDVEGRITELGMINSNAKLLPKDIVLVALNGRGKTRGSVAILKVEAACNQSIAAIVLQDKGDPEYLMYHLENRYEELRNITGDKDRSGLNLRIIGNLPVALPTPQEQQRIAVILSTIDEKLELFRKERAKLIRLKDGFMRELLTGKIRVKVQS
jgi:type I restriction enzyme S subunit